VRRSLLLLAGLALTPALRAQEPVLRAFTSARQLHGETRLGLRLAYEAGTLRLAPGARGDLYRTRLVYDERRWRPVSRYDAGRGMLTLSLEPAGGAAPLRLASREPLGQLATVALSPQVETALELDLGAVEGDLELGGLRLTSLDLSTEASRTVVHFSAPNGTRCSQARFTAGAAELVVVGLGHARCDAVRFDGGMGNVTLDFSGAWTGSTRVSVKMTAGGLTLRLPRSAGVRVTLDKFLASFRPAGLTARGTSWVSPGWDRAEHRLDLAVTSTIGGIAVEWVD
jgi:hypothetical protein